MLRWAWKSLISHRGSLLSSGVGIASAFILVFFFDAVFRGESEQIIAYPKNMDADVWVMQRGVSNMHMAVSFVWDWKADKIASMAGVKRVTPILYLNTIVNTRDKELFSFVVGLLPDDHRAGPWKMAAGRKIQRSGEAVIPDVLAKLSNVDIGDTITLTDKTFVIVGLSADTYSSANPVIFVPFSDLEDITSSTGTYSYLLVDAEEGIDASKLATQIRNEVSKVNALPQEKFITNDFAMAIQMGVEIIYMMTIICTLLAILIVGFSAYSLVSRKKQELAIIKALGMRSKAILTGVVLQSCLLTSFFGFMIAVGFAYFIMPYLSILVPQVTLAVSVVALAKFGVMALVVAVAGAIVPAYLVSRVDPATAFNG